MRVREHVQKRRRRGHLEVGVVARVFFVELAAVLLAPRAILRQVLQVLLDQLLVLLALLPQLLLGLG